MYHDRHLEGVEDVEMGPLLGPDGKAPEGKNAKDAESLALLPDGGFIVGFEREHHLLPCPAPPGLENAPFNGGIEALVALRGGGLLALTEYWIWGASPATFGERTSAERKRCQPPLTGGMNTSSSPSRRTWSKRT